MSVIISEVPERGAQPATEAFLAGGGELGARLRAMDWAATPLGPAGAWPTALKTLVAVMLGARQPMFVAWGPERTMLYNDGYATICGARHPAALGRRFREVWFDILDDVEPILERAFAGEGTHMDDIALLMHRNGYPEETRFSFSYTPVRDDTGAVAGMFCACTETTGRVMAERRQEFRLGLEARLRELAEPRAVMATAAAALAAHLGCDRAGYAEVHPDGQHFTVEGEWCGPGVPSLAGQQRLEDYDPALIAELRAGRTIAVADARDDPLTVGRSTAASFRAAAVRAAVTVPLVKAGRFAASLFVHRAAPRRWTQEDLVLVQEVAERTWGAVGRARAEAALRASEARWRGLFARMQEGFALCELVRDAAGRPVDFRYLEVNAAWEHLTGLPAGRVIGRLAREVIPGLEPYWVETYARVIETGEPAHVEYRVAALDRWFEVLAYRTEPGRFAALFLNVTDRKRAEARQALLTREVEHRAKNALAVVQSVLRLTRAEDLPTYVRAVEGRVSALSRAQSLLADDHSGGAELRELLAGELAPFLAGQRVELHGPPVLLPAVAAQPVAMAVHELATNAVKHGALSVPGGRLAVRWEVPDGQPPRLRLHWAEAGGPAVTGPPPRRGFGGRVLDGTVRGQLGGTVALDWQATGLVCRLDLPLGAGMG
ncbi:GAF domain-containing protein [Dankookia rubra]|uniref:histidine kinase n=1 Tax=Dankookia rubra TaxID=1442381 RepID=A0A4R5QF96_9PROT|nr:HWE histidine kinase domain-containing protein [Dankookia rubra]TDH61369.1 GAF domain-containing protein [Dankookia rubra]